MNEGEDDELSILFVTLAEKKNFVFEILVYRKGDWMKNSETSEKIPHKNF